ncbi:MULTISPECIES: S9 family peptidase [unclassified Wenzhouxiangella]|uniref:S9 family peptidase n=1 Tax=unclassified Wenzhouxiangella TaxID=2613841 RepID=UPI000E326B72|nr:MULTISPECIES: S9 family peptidase [unclassified Wenzhouxiangella]RFF27087.1 S9 family peptidase [Wenzhouxiangella sp. 15181]RFP67874.1 S9 family peptidase [Wenzhouxiangella sp. 15190]
MRTRLTAILISFLLTGAAFGQDEPLRLERIFSSPDLAGPTLRQAELSPSGDRVTFLKGSEDDRNLLDLWEYHVADDTMRVLVAADEVMSEETELSAAEQARRERERIADLRGIVDYRWSADGRFLLFPIGGNIFLLDMEAEERTVRQLTESEAFDTDPQIAPDGRHVAFVRDRDLWLVATEGGEARPLTDSATDTIANGVAEFIAQEEMGRSTGFWWSPTGQHVAFLQIDESPVEVTRRYEVQADTIEMVEQRYPYAGTDNVTYRLGVIDIESGTTTWMDLGDETDIYIPRVKWLPNGEQLSFQRQSRDQQSLELVVANIDSGDSRAILTENSDTWINLHDDLYFLSEMPAFIWSSERDGFRHLYLYDYEGEVIRRLTDGPWQVDEMVGVDEEMGMVYFNGSEVSTTEKHLYRQSLITRSPEVVNRISRRSGWHEVGMDKAARIYVDTFSSSRQPPQLSLHSVDGERLAWLVENRLDEEHPYSPYRDGHRPTEFGSIVAPEGHELHYRLIRPADFDPEKKYPVFVHVYGGPTHRMVTDNWSRRMLIDQYMARRGYVVFSLDNRGVERQGKAFQEPAYLKLGQVEMRDQMVGVDWLRAQDFVDPDRIGIFGWSYGGYMSLMALAQYPGEFAAGVSVAPVTNWTLYDTHYTERYMGRPQDQPDVYKQGNVLTYADAMTDPLLLVHGMADDNVLFTHSTKLMNDLQNRAYPFELMTYPGEKHAIAGDGPRLHAYRTITDFLDRHLLEGESEKGGETMQ